MEKQDVTGMSGKSDTPAIKKAEDGKTYEGKIVSFAPNKVVQAVTDGQQTYLVEHDRFKLSGAKSGLIEQGKDLSIRYAYAGGQCRSFPASTAAARVVLAHSCCRFANEDELGDVEWFAGL